MKGVVLAGGLGTRLLPMTRVTLVAVALGESSRGRSLTAMSGSEGSTRRSAAISWRTRSRIRSVRRSIPDVLSASVLPAVFSMSAKRRAEKIPG